MKDDAAFGSFLLFLSVSFVVLAEEKAIPVSIVKVAIAPVYEEIPLTGSVTARRVSLISAKTEGFVAELVVDEGDVVEKNDALLYLDPVIAKIGLNRVKAQVQEAEAILKEAKRQRDEASELVKKKHISATNYEASVADVQIKAASLRRLQADLSQQRETLARHVVYAPFDGAVSSKKVEVGQWVETSTALFELVDISVLRVDVPVPQIYFNRIAEGTIAVIKFDAIPERSFEARVSIKIPAGNASTRTFPIRIEINNGERMIAPGMSARVRIKLPQVGEAMLLPRDAIVRKPDGRESIWLLTRSNGVSKARPLTIETGRAYGDNIEVITGDLQVGDKVIIRGNEILRPNQLIYVAGEHELKL